MYERVTCTCGRVLSSYAPIYRKALYAKQCAIGTDKLIINMNGSIQVTSTMSLDILDQLGIYKTCCRIRMVTNVKFPEYAGMGTHDIQ
jgi:DNA-directed RNA polymerase subunit N (RpoN/RPB10)